MKAASTEEQLSAYAMAYYAEADKLPDKVRLDVAVNMRGKPLKKSLQHYVKGAETKHGSVGIVLLEAERTQEDINHYLNVMDQTISGLNAGIFNYAAPMAWWCGPDACEYWDYCRKRGPIEGRNG
jgi:hypothetical protein